MDEQELNVLVTKAILLGYCFELEGGDWYNIQLPSGEWMQGDGLPYAYYGLLEAALAALKNAGVYDGRSRSDGMQRRSHEDTIELVQSRVADFVNGDASEDVLKASLRALGLDRDEINFEFWKACKLKMRTHAPKEGL